ncbi:DUF11 domain-containing protein [Chloroflexi bacterium TSY]|nr:DUF11 domain-containing protein [Chloroflexi bacterium TSY]
MPSARALDMGDAADSTNHHGLDNTAYPGILGNFPTVWEDSPASGPAHEQSNLFWLGDDISFEVDADKLPKNAQLLVAPVQSQNDTADEPTSVGLTSFTATHISDEIVVRWVTSSEFDTSGFHLYRGTNGNFANAVRMTEQMIVSQGTAGGTYETRFSYNPATDPGLETLTVWLAEIERNGTTNIFGPIAVTTHGVTNILNNGTADVANRDRGDDGWLNRDARFANCEATELVVRVRWNGTPVRDFDLLYLNAWYDGNGDGDWDDVGLCHDDTQRSFEWIIQNATYNNPSFVSGDFVDIPLGTLLVHKKEGNGPAWLRLTLSDRAVKEWGEGMPDGRGPPYPDRYKFGETEDYLVGVPQGEPKITIEKKASHAEVNPGQEIEYTIQIQNNGDAPAVGVSVLDRIPTGTTYVPESLTSSKPSADHDPTNNRVKWSGDLSANGSVTITFKVRVDDNAKCGSMIYNRAFFMNASGAELQGDEVRVLVVCPDPPKIQVDKKVSKSTIAPGGLLDYEITIVNGSNVAAAGVTLVDPIPAGTSYVANSATSDVPSVSYNIGANRVEWSGTVPANGSVTIKFSVRVDQKIDCKGEIVNTAIVRAPFLRQWLEAQARSKVECPAEPALNIVKRASQSIVAPGSTIDYAITIFNGGNVPAVGATMIDPIPPGTIYLLGSVNSTNPTAIYNNPNNRIEWTGTVPANGSVTVKFSVTVKDEAECDSIIVNKAIIRWNNQTAESSTRTKVDCPKEPDLAIRKSASPEIVSPGDEIEYTIGVTNSGSAPAIGVTIVDPIPAGTSYESGSLNFSAPNAVYDNLQNWIKWVGDIPAGGSIAIKFKVQVSDDVECKASIFNRAAIIRPRDLSVIEQATAKVHVECEQQDVYRDFGDAPDSTFNHYGIDNTAYPGVGTLGRFPPVWEGTPPGEPSGPAHHLLYWLWLGEHETRELDADLLPDSDGITNILDNGTNDVADDDRADDGWLNPTVAFENCQTTRLKVHVSKSAVAANIEKAYLNVWLDGTYDGDWEDSGICDNQDQRSYEWIVQNHVVNAGAIPVNGSMDIDVPTELIHNISTADTPQGTGWIRFTLSERPAVKPATGALPDGRGPDYPAFFRLGETEDYLPKRDIPGQPRLEIRKKADVSRVQPGGMIEYAIQIHNGGSGPANGFSVVDPIPAGTTYVAGSATASDPAVDDSDPTQIKWVGSIPAGTTVTIKFKVSK